MSSLDTPISYARIPIQLLGTYLPVQGISVIDFLAWPLPAFPSASTLVGAVSCQVTDDIPNTELTVENLTAKVALPTRQVIRMLLDREPADIESAVRLPSVAPTYRMRHQSKSKPHKLAPVTLPLEILDIWSVIIQLHDTQIAWRKAVQQLETTDAPFAKEAVQQLEILPWGGAIRGGQTRSAITSLTKYLDPTAWLSDNHLADQAEFLQYEIQRRGRTDAVVWEPMIATLIRNAYRRRDEQDYLTAKPLGWLRRAGEKLVGDKPVSVFGTVHVGGNHWIAFVIDGEARTLALGDSLSRDVDDEAKEALVWWIGKHVAPPSKPSANKFTFIPLTIARQHGTSDCGILAHNSLQHHLDPKTYAILDLPQAVYPARVAAFLQVVKRHGTAVRSFLLADLRLALTRVHY